MARMKVRRRGLRRRKTTRRHKREELPTRPSADEVARRHGLRELTPAELEEFYAQILPPDGEG